MEGHLSQQWHTNQMWVHHNTLVRYHKQQMHDAERNAAAVAHMRRVGVMWAVDVENVNHDDWSCWLALAELSRHKLKKCDKHHADSRHAVTFQVRGKKVIQQPRSQKLLMCRESRAASKENQWNTTEVLLPVPLHTEKMWKNHNCTFLTIVIRGNKRSITPTPDCCPLISLTRLQTAFHFKIKPIYFWEQFILMSIWIQSTKGPFLPERNPNMWRERDEEKRRC